LAKIANVVSIGCGSNCFPKDTGAVLYMLAEEENKKETHACMERKEDQ
jgi:UDP-glucose 6-dehydrogenase